MKILTALVVALVLSLAAAASPEAAHAQSVGCFGVAPLCGPGCAAVCLCAGPVAGTNCGWACNC